jgi:hypothetical protein
MKKKKKSAVLEAMETDAWSLFINNLKNSMYM